MSTAPTVRPWPGNPDLATLYPPAAVERVVDITRARRVGSAGGRRTARAGGGAVVTEELLTLDDAAARTPWSTSTLRRAIKTTDRTLSRRRCELSAARGDST